MNRMQAENVKYYKNFGVFLKEIRKKYEKKRAVSWYTRKGEEKIRTYEELAGDVEALKNAFLSKGFTGKRLALIGENSYEWLLVYLASAACGASAVCIDAEQSADGILFLTKQAACEALFVSDSCAEIFRGQETKQLFYLEAEKKSEQKTVGELCEEGREKKGLPEIELTGDETAAIVYTSGTTGSARPVMLSQKGILINAAECNIYVEIGAKTYSALPFCHTYGMTCAVLAAFLRGAELSFNGNLRTAMRDMHFSGAWSLMTVPLMLEVICQQIRNRAAACGKGDELRKFLKWQRMKRRLGIKKIPEFVKELRKEVLGSIGLIICGGAPMDAETAKELTLMGLEVLQGYGITECSPLVSVNPNRNGKLESVGKPLPGCKVRIVEGEIWVSSPSVMQGYYGMPEKTGEVLFDGWFKTGDLGMIDKDGFLYITGRKKNLIVFKNGKKISPEAYEEKLRRLRYVKDVLVYGTKAEKKGDDVKLAASIYPDPQAAQGMYSYEILEELQKEIDKINGTLPLYQQIQMINIREQEFDRTAMLKIKRYM